MVTETFAVTRKGGRLFFESTSPSVGPRKIPTKTFKKGRNVAGGRAGRTRHFPLSSPLISLICFADNSPVIASVPQSETQTCTKNTSSRFPTKQATFVLIGPESQLQTSKQSRNQHVASCTRALPMMSSVFRRGGQPVYP